MQLLLFLCGTKKPNVFKLRLPMAKMWSSATTNAPLNMSPLYVISLLQFCFPTSNYTPPDRRLYLFHRWKWCAIAQTSSIMAKTFLCILGNFMAAASSRALLQWLTSSKQLHNWYACLELLKTFLPSVCDSANDVVPTTVHRSSHK